MEYIEERCRRVASEWVLAAAEKSISLGAGLLVFPELFVPAETLDKLRQLVDHTRMAVVCGMQPVGGEDQYSNTATILLPGERKTFTQYKAYPSNYEPANLATRGGQLCFQRSAVGSFSVVLCSDLREFDVLAAIEMQPFLDYVVVCCCNPYVDVWTHLACADAALLQSYVVLANWSKDPGDNGFGKGSLCAAPIGEEGSDSGRTSQTERVSVNVGEVEYVGAVTLYHLQLSALFRDRAKPASGFLAPPRRRLQINPNR